MADLLLKQRLRALCESNATLLWLEGAKHDRVLSVRLSDKRLILQLANNTSRVVAFERFAVTSVGLQFWSQGRPCVLYRWEQVPTNTWNTASSQNTAHVADDMGSGGDEPPPPNMAA